MINYLVRNIQIVDSGKIMTGDVLIHSGRFHAINSRLGDPGFKYEEINGEGKFLIPGIIDVHVHFREPGLTHKGDINSESKAALAGGVTSFIDMPNTLPNTTTVEYLKEKFDLAAEKSLANYSFYIGATNKNFHDLSAAKNEGAAGIKIFLGSSTGNMLVDDLKMLEKIFSESGQLVVVHAEDDAIINNNFQTFRQQYGDEIPFRFHPEIRSSEACFKATKEAIDLALKFGTRMHIAHVSTAEETALFDNQIKLSDKKITAETGIQYLFFDADDYESLGSKIKCNPSIKEKTHKKVLFEALLNDKIDFIASDHASHTWEEKSKPYTTCPSGIPLIQHALPVMLGFYKQNKITLEKMVEKMCHAPAISHHISERGFIKEGYKADFVILDLDKQETVSKNNILYKCGWSPFEGMKLNQAVEMTFINGQKAYDHGIFANFITGEKLGFY